jgi:hypothetical protein
MVTETTEQPGYGIKPCRVHKATFAVSLFAKGFNLQSNTCDRRTSCARLESQRDTSPVGQMTAYGQTQSFNDVRNGSALHSMTINDQTSEQVRAPIGTFKGVSLTRISSPATFTPEPTKCVGHR